MSRVPHYGEEGVGERTTRAEEEKNICGAFFKHLPNQAVILYNPEMDHILIISRRMFLEAPVLVVFPANILLGLRKSIKYSHVSTEVPVL